MTQRAEREAHDRIVSEAHFHDQRVRNILSEPHADVRKSQTKYYWVTERYDQALRSLIERLSRDHTVLEIGCFTGARTAEIAQVAKFIVGVDISAEAVKLTKTRLAGAGVRSGSAMVTNAECLPFADNVFDVIFGTGVIHHVDVAKCAREMHRVLKPRGCALFREALGHNPVMNLYRRLTPRARTEDEHPLLIRDLSILESFFSIEDSHFFGLSSLLATPFRTVVGGRLLRDAFGWMDAWFLRIPQFRKYAWQVNLVMRK